MILIRLGVIYSGENACSMVNRKTGNQQTEKKPVDGDDDALAWWKLNVSKLPLR